MVEPIISIACLLLILYLGRMGAAFGMFFEMTSTVLLLFAMLATLRFWYPFSQWFSAVGPVSGIHAIFVSYWILFLLGSIPLIVVMKQVNEDSRPKYPAILDKVLGFLFGAASGAIVICAVMTSLSVILPTLWKDYEHRQILFSLDTLPLTVYQEIENNVAGIDDKDPSHTRFPSLEREDIQEAEKGESDKLWR